MTVQHNGGVAIPRYAAIHSADLNYTNPNASARVHANITKCGNALL